VPARDLLPERDGKHAALTLTVDNDPDFTDQFCAFLQRSVPSVDAAELLLLLAENREKSWELGELRDRLATMSVLSEADVVRNLDTLQNGEVVARQGDRRFRYRASPSFDGHVATLARLYVERPVTLFRTIYALRDAKIKTFADAFKLRG
jgi:hypothetical protein